jgi:hypothetical protein
MGGAHPATPVRTSMLVIPNGVYASSAREFLHRYYNKCYCNILKSSYPYVPRPILKRHFSDSLRVP